VIHTMLESHTARQAHRCDSCNEPILPGETYRRWRSYDCRDVTTNRMHPECYTLHMDGLLPGESEFEYSPGEHPRPRADQWGKII
jgi:hypothetical protein